MKINKNWILSLALIITLLFGATPVASAHDDADFQEWYEWFKEEGKYHVEETNNSARGMCYKCSWYTASVCYDDSRLADYGYHNNIFGIQTDCYAYYYVSRGAEVCMSCNTIQEIYAGEHACWENHTSCGKGVYDICIMEHS